MCEALTAAGEALEHRLAEERHLGGDHLSKRIKRSQGGSASPSRMIEQNAHSVVATAAAAIGPWRGVAEDPFIHVASGFVFFGSGGFAGSGGRVRAAIQGLAAHDWVRAR